MSEQKEIVSPSDSELKFKSHFKASLVFSFLGVVSLLSIVIYLVAWMRLSVVFELFSSVNAPFEFLITSFKIYLLTIKTMYIEFAVSILIMLLSSIYGVISLYRYLLINNKPRKLLLSLFTLSWFIFMAVPFWSYIPIFFFWIAIYYKALSLK